MITVCPIGYLKFNIFAYRLHECMILVFTGFSDVLDLFLLDPIL
jgi:hypothetical protein